MADLATQYQEKLLKAQLHVEDVQAAASEEISNAWINAFTGTVSAAASIIGKYGPYSFPTSYGETLGGYTSPIEEMEEFSWQ